MEINSAKWHRTVIDGALALGVAVSPDQARTMGAHALELTRWNRAMNLTAITEPLDVAVKHYVDALAAAPWIGRATRVLDAGSGGGFPGMPLKILRPDLTLTMVDSVRKKVSFLKHAIRTLGLEGIDAVHGRLESISQQPAYRGRFDMVICRAFSSLEDFAALTVAFLAPGGALLALKGPQTDHGREVAGECKEGALQLGDIPFSIRVHHYCLPILDSRRRLVKLVPLTED